MMNRIPIIFLVIIINNPCMLFSVQGLRNPAVPDYTIDSRKFPSQYHDEDDKPAWFDPPCSLQDDGDEDNNGQRPRCCGYALPK